MSAATSCRTGRSAAQLLGPINTAGLLGMAIGSVTLGWLGDRIGRKKSYFTCLVFLFIGSVLCYLAAKSGTPENAKETIGQMTIWRFVTGLGMGGITPLATTPDFGMDLGARAQRRRGARDLLRARRRLARRFRESVTCSGSSCSWSAVSCRSGCSSCSASCCRRSPKYMAQRPALHARLAKSLNRLIGEKRFDGTENFVVREAGKRSSHWLATIWNSFYARATLFIWIAFSFNSFVLYMYTNYLKVLLPSDRVPESWQAARSACSRSAPSSARSAVRS